MVSLWNIVILCLCLFTIHAAKANGRFAILEARPARQSSTSSKLSVCVLYNSQYQNLPSQNTEAIFLHLADLTSHEGCSGQDFNSTSLGNNMVAVSRGNCTFVHKALMVQALHGAAVLVVDYKNSTQLTYPGGNESEFLTLNITLATIAYSDYISIISLSESVEAALYAPTASLLDGNMVVWLICSTLLVVAGAIWTAYDEWHSRWSRVRTSQPHELTDEEESEGASRNDGPEISVVGIVIWFICICGILLLLYFFYDYMVYFFIALFCIIGAYSLYKNLLPLWSWIMPVSYGIPVNRLPCFRRKIKLRSLLLLLPCFSIAIFWVVQRHSPYAWIVQDLLGASFCIYFLHTVHLPNLKVISVLLILLLLYDVFFVFITPLFTSDGTSIMESVATGRRSDSKEMLPMVFLMPSFSDAPIMRCSDHKFSMLGFGDVIIPGLLLSYNALFDVRMETRMVYMICSSIGYFVGMIVCLISLIYMNSGQPALLYLVPATLFTTLFVAVVRKEVRILFLGQHKQQHKFDDSIESQAVDNEEGDFNNGSVVEEQRNLIN